MISRPILRVLFVVTSLMLLTTGGCSKIRLAYSHLDWILVRTASGYLDLNSEQKDRLNADLEQVLTWHRETMVPRYAKYFRKNAEKVERKEFDREFFDLQAKNAETLVRQTVGPFLPVVSSVLVDLGPDQVTYLEKKLEESNKKFLDQVGESPDKRVGRMTKTVEQFFERWLVKLNSDQKKIVKKHIEDRLGNPEAWWEERIRRQKQLIALLRSKEDGKKGKVQKFLEVAIVRPESDGPKEYREQVARFRSSANDLAFAVISSLDLQQKRTLQSRLSHYAWEFEEITRSYATSLFKKKPELLLALL